MILRSEERWPREVRSTTTFTDNRMHGKFYDFIPIAVALGLIAFCVAGSFAHW
jgi:hypothetical protein